MTVAECDPSPRPRLAGGFCLGGLPRIRCHSRAGKLYRLRVFGINSLGAAEGVIPDGRGRFALLRSTRQRRSNGTGEENTGIGCRHLRRGVR